MPIQLAEENGGKILVVHVTGKLVRADYEQLCSRVRATPPTAREAALTFRHGRFPRLGRRRVVGRHQVRH